MPLKITVHPAPKLPIIPVSDDGGRAFPAAAGEMAASGGYPDEAGTDSELDAKFSENEKPALDAAGEQAHAGIDISPAPGAARPTTEPGTDAEMQSMFSEHENAALDAAGEQAHHSDDIEPAVRRYNDEHDQLAAVRDLATKGGVDPTKLLTSLADANKLSDNGLAEHIVNHNRSYSEMLASVGRDVGRGVIEMPHQVLGGVRDAAQAAIDGVGAIGDWLNNHVADLDAMAGLTPAAGKTTQMPELPGVAPAKTVTGGIARSVSQFLAGFAAGGKVLGLAGRPGFAAAAGKGAFADLAAFDAHEQRLSDLLQQVPVLQNPVTEYLSHAAGDEGEIEGRLKRAAEGLGLGVATQGLLLGLKAIRSARMARSAEPVAPPPAPEAAPMTLLGDENAPLVPRAADLKPRPKSVVDDLGVPDDVAARSLTPEGMTPLMGEGSDAVYVNFARIKGSDDVKRVIADTLAATREDIDKARRGVRSNLTTVLASGKEDAWDLIASRRRGQPFNAEESVAVRRLWEASAGKLLEVADTASKMPSPENLFQFRKMLATHAAIQQEVTAARTETARALQSWAIPVGGSKEAMRSISEMLERFGGVDVNLDLARRVASLQNIPNGLSALGEIAERSAFLKSLDAVKEVWVNGLLSGPKTHVVNFMSNTAVSGLQIMERAAAARWGQITGSGNVPVGEAMAQWFGMMQGQRDALRNAWMTLKTGQSGFGIGKVDLPRERAISARNAGVDENSWLGRSIDIVGAGVSMPGRLLTVSDEYSKSVAYRMELNAQAFRTASREVQDGTIPQAALKSRMADIIANPPENIRMASTDAATYQTFTSQPGAMVQGLNRLEQKWEQSGVGGALSASLLRFVLPFRNTPANIFKYTMERTPMAPLTERYRDAIARGGADADIARTRMALGTTMILTATDLAMDGHVTGSGPGKTEHSKRDAQYRSGWQPYSIKIGDRYFAYSRMDPLGFTIGIGADLGEYLNEADFDEKTGVEIQKAVSAAAMSIGNNALSKNYLRGVSEFLTALSGSEGQATTWVERMAGSFVPTGAAEVTRAVDPYMRATHDMVSRLKSRTPGLSSDLPMQRDVYGRPKSYASGLGKTYDAVSPVYSHQEHVEPIDREQMEQGWYIGMPKPTGMEAEAYSRFLDLQGATKASSLSSKLAQQYGDRTLLDRLNSLVDGDDRLATQYQKLPKGEDRKKFVGKIVAAYRKAAKAKLEAEAPATSDDE